LLQRGLDLILNSAVYIDVDTQRLARMRRLSDFP
jgi:hypothetical protein